MRTAAAFLEMAETGSKAHRCNVCGRHQIIGNDEPVFEMLLHTLEQTFQAGAVRSRRASYSPVSPLFVYCLLCVGSAILVVAMLIPVYTYLPELFLH